MPYYIRRPRLRRLLCALAGAAAITGAAPALAGACAIQTSAGGRPFAQYGDEAYYTLVPGGSFASGAPGWSLDDAWLSGGQGQFSGSLTIAAGGEAISPPICVSSATPTFRFFARQATGGWAEMNVVVLWTNSLGQAETTTAGGLSLNSGWAPSQIYPLGAMLPTESGTTFLVRIELLPAYVANTGAGDVAVAGFYVDPYSRS